MNHDLAYKKATVRYVLGAVGAALVTGVVYTAAVGGWFASAAAIAVFALVLAGVQLAIQVATFLHLGSEQRPRWQSMSFVFTLITALIIVVGSIWIMLNLNYNMHMTPQQMEEYMSAQNKKGF